MKLWGYIVTKGGWARSHASLYAKAGFRLEEGTYGIAAIRNNRMVFIHTVAGGGWFPISHLKEVTEMPQEEAEAIALTIKTAKEYVYDGNADSGVASEDETPGVPVP